MSAPLDIACIGGHMEYCKECKHGKRWEVVGELSRDERPGTTVITDEVCMLTKGSRFVKADEVVLS